MENLAVCVLRDNRRYLCRRSYILTTLARQSKSTSSSLIWLLKPIMASLSLWTIACKSEQLYSTAGSLDQIQRIQLAFSSPSADAFLSTGSKLHGANHIRTIKIDSGNFVVQDLRFTGKDLEVQTRKSFLYGRTCI